MASTAASIRRVAREVFGFDDLRPGQLDAITSVLAGRDTLAVLPTGSGKSAIYQIAALLLDGPTVVVSPLIALHHDQLRSIAEKLPADSGAVVANSTLRAVEREATFARLAAGTVEFLFLAPEQFANDETMAAVRDARPSLFVVDEAHCISAWGHDFRPDYLRLGDVVDVLGHPTTLALTATAAPPVRDEIVERLAMRDAEIVVRGFDRPNIRLAVTSFHEEADKHAAVVTRVQLATPPGIVYVATRKAAEALAAELVAGGVKAAVYHGGMKAKDRSAAQDAFLGGEVDVVVATIAFGMGIDKPDVRFVYHHDVSDSLDSYYQEIGRAGRDGLPADATLFFLESDLGLRRFFAGGGRIGVEHLTQVAQAVDEVIGSVPVAVLQAVTGLSQTKLDAALHRLEEVGAVHVMHGGEVEAVDGADPVAAAEEAAGAEETHRRVERSRVEMMRAYAEARDCRRRFLLGYFGEQLPKACGNCDVCEAGLSEDIVDAGPGELLASGAEVVHAEWGRGTVVELDDETVVVLFDEVGYKTLARELIAARDLLAPA